MGHLVIRIQHLGTGQLSEINSTTSGSGIVRPAVKTSVEVNSVNAIRIVVSLGDVNSIYGVP